MTGEIGRSIQGNTAFSHLSLRLTRTLGVAGSTGPFNRGTGEGEAVAVAVAVATGPETPAPSVRGLVPRPPKVNAGSEAASGAGLGAVKEKLDAEGGVQHGTDVYYFK